MSPLAGTLVAQLRDRPSQFSELVDQHRDVPWPEFLRAWGEVRGREDLTRDEDGRYLFGPSVKPDKL